MKFEHKEVRNKKGELERIELRPAEGSELGADMLVIIGSDGWNYKSESKDLEYGKWTRNDVGSSHFATHGTKGKNIRFSCNSPLMFSWHEWKSLIDEIDRLTENF